MILVSTVQMCIPITATASGSLKPERLYQFCNSFRHNTRFIHTGEIKEVRLLVELVENRARAVFQVTGCEDRDAIPRQFPRESGATVWHGSGSTAQVEDSAAGAPAAIVKKLADAVIRAFPQRLEEPIAVP